MLLYLSGAIAGPLIHILTEHCARTVSAQNVDPDSFRNARTGRVDLVRLAAALGLEEETAHPHSHRPGSPSPQGPLDHGAGAIEHFGVALVGSASQPVVTVTAAPAPLPPRLSPAPTPTPSRWYLDAHPSQGPPIV
jgi:hypothetical protein